MKNLRTSTTPSLCTYTEINIFFVCLFKNTNKLDLKFIKKKSYRCSSCMKKINKTINTILKNENILMGKMKTTVNPY